MLPGKSPPPREGGGLKLLYMSEHNCARYMCWGRPWGRSSGSGSGLRAEDAAACMQGDGGVGDASGHPCEDIGQRGGHHAYGHGQQIIIRSTTAKR